MRRAVAQVIRQCGNELTRENVMRQAGNLDFYNGVTLPGIKIKTGPSDFKPIEQFQMMRVKGDNWERLGESHRSTDFRITPLRIRSALLTSGEAACQ